MFNPSSDNRGRIQQLISSQPNRRDCNRVEGNCLCIQDGVVNARRSFLAAAMRRRHPHLPALVLHHAAAGTLLGAHFRIGNHAAIVGARHDASSNTSTPNRRRTRIPVIRLRLPDEWSKQRFSEYA